MSDILMPDELKQNIHASCIKIGRYGVLLLGKSGAGKSDLALRLIENKNAVLVADDRVDVCRNNNGLYASSPQNLSGLLEVRGVGIVNVKHAAGALLALAVELVEKPEQIERFPKDEYFVIDEVKIPLLKLYPFESSAVDKIVIKLKAVLDKIKK